MWCHLNIGETWRGVTYLQIWVSEWRIWQTDCVGGLCPGILAGVLHHGSLPSNSSVKEREVNWAGLNSGSRLDIQTLLCCNSSRLAAGVVFSQITGSTYCWSRVWNTENAAVCGYFQNGAQTAVLDVCFKPGLLPRIICSMSFDLTFVCKIDK